MINENDVARISRLIISGINLIVEGDCKPLTLNTPCFTAPDKYGFSRMGIVKISLTTKNDCFNCPTDIVIDFDVVEKDLRITSEDGELLWDSKRPMVAEVSRIVEEFFEY